MKTIHDVQMNPLVALTRDSKSLVPTVEIVLLLLDKQYSLSPEGATVRSCVIEDVRFLATPDDVLSLMVELFNVWLAMEEIGRRLDDGGFDTELARMPDELKPTFDELRKLVVKSVKPTEEATG